MLGWRSFAFLRGSTDVSSPAQLVKPEKAAPPAGSLPTYVLYVVSVVSFLVTLYLFALRPCCCDPTRRHDDGGAAGAGGPLSGLVVPVLSGGGGGPGGKKPGMFGGKRGKRGMRGMQQQGTTVNLIVDPTLLGGGGGQREDDSEDSDAEEHLPGGARRRKRRRGRAAGQLGVLGNMKLQARWRVARKSLKVNTVWDCILAVLWIAADVLALAIGKKCPPGSSGGWCDLYNGAIACGVIIVVVFCASIYFDFRDLRCVRRSFAVACWPRSLPPSLCSLTQDQQTRAQTAHVGARLCPLPSPFSSLPPPIKISARNHITNIVCAPSPSRPLFLSFFLASHYLRTLV